MVYSLVVRNHKAFAYRRPPLSWLEETQGQSRYCENASFQVMTKSIQCGQLTIGPLANDHDGADGVAAVGGADYADDVVGSIGADACYSFPHEQMEPLGGGI